MNLQEKINNVKNFIKDKKIAISFSGGADSTLIAYLAAQVSDNPIAITVDNKIMPEGFVENAEVKETKPAKKTAAKAQKPAEENVKAEEAKVVEEKVEKAEAEETAKEEAKAEEVKEDKDETPEA